MKMKKMICAIVFFVAALGLQAASRLTDYMDTQDTYLIAYINVDSVREANIYSTIKANLPTKQDKSDIVAVYYPEASAKGITEKDISEAALCVDVVQSKPIMKETISYQLGIKLKKSISKEDVVSILTADPSGKSKFTTKQITVSLMKVIQITSGENSMFVYMPDSKTIFATDNLNDMINLTSRYKAKNPTTLPERMVQQKKLVSEDSAIYIIAAVPPAVRGWLEEEDSKVKPSGDQTQDLVSSLRVIIKNLTGVTITAKMSDTLDVKAVALFINKNAANILNGLLNQYMPLIKLQIFMMTKSNTQIPFLNSVVNRIEGNNLVLTFSLTNDDIEGVLNLSPQNQQFNLN